MKINEAVKIVENTRETEFNQALKCLMAVNDGFNKKHGVRLFSFFEMVAILNCSDEALSYTVSNIEIFTKQKLDKNNT